MTVYPETHDDGALVRRRPAGLFPQLAPAHEAVAAGRRRPVSLRNISPGRTRSQPPADAVQHPAIIGPRHAAWLVRQQRRDDRPFKIRQLVSAWGHDGSL